jgi:hypothetical protein
MILQDYDKYTVHLNPDKAHSALHGPHQLSMQCWCKPIQDEEEPTVIIHHEYNPDQLN